MQVAIIIPFFQREEGILSNCLRSIFAQKGGINYHIFIVNDESPIAPEQELISFSSQQQAQITIINRKNGGPGKARNTALNTINPTEFEYIAFIDSDDQWEVSHLEVATTTLSMGYDFYFANFFQLNSVLSAMEKAEKNGKFNTQDHQKISGTTIYAYQGHFPTQIICGNLIGTSSVVFKTSIGGKVRFNQNFYFAGEDYLFWLALTDKTNKIVFNTQCTCRCGKGVNIYSANGWGTPFALERIRDELKYLKLTRRYYPLPPNSESFRVKKINNLKASALSELKHRIFRLKPINPKTFAQLCSLVITR